MMDKYSDYKDLDLAVINSNMPVHFAFVDEIIIAMTDSKCLPGEEKRTRRCEKATLLTSSPSRTNLQAKPDKKRGSSTRREQKSNRRRTLKHITFLRFLTTRRRRAVPVYNASNFTEIADPELYGFHAKSTFNGPMKIALMGPLSSSVPNVTRVMKILPKCITCNFFLLLKCYVLVP